MEINQQGKWLSILDYAQHKGVSISSIRRYIKAGRVKFKQESGKYFIWVSNYSSKVDHSEKKENRLINKIKALQEENQELRMLVDLYEGQLRKKPQNVELPEIPVH